jgi:hypothetical protein
MFWNKICGFIAIFFLSANFSSAQIAFSVNFQNKEIAKPQYNLIAKPNNKEVLKPSLAFEAIPQNYYTQHFGIMCKKELALEKATKIPFRFRLGSLQQCNYLEGKK